MRRLDQSDAAGIAGGGFELDANLLRTAHQHLVEMIDLPAAPAFIVLVNEAPGIEQQLQRHEGPQLQQLRVDLRLRRAVDGHAANNASRSIDVSCEGSALASEYNCVTSACLSACNCMIFSSTVPLTIGL